MRLIVWQHELYYMILYYIIFNLHFIAIPALEIIAISLRDCFVILVVALSDFWNNPMGIKAGCWQSVCVHKRGFGSDCKSINRRQRPALRCCDETFMQRCPWPVGALRQMNSIKISKWFFRVCSEACSQVLHKTGSYESYENKRGKQWAVTSHEYPDDRCLEGVRRNGGSLQASHSLSRSPQVSVSHTHSYTNTEVQADTCC